MTLHRIDEAVQRPRLLARDWPGTICSLKQRRAELVSELVTLQARSEEVERGIAALDGTLRLLDPDYRPAALKPALRRKKSKLFPRGSFSRRLGEVLRAAPGPMSAREMAPLVATAAKIPVLDDRVLRIIAREIGRALRAMRRKGLVCSRCGDGREAMWQLVMPRPAYTESGLVGRTLGIGTMERRED